MNSSRRGLLLGLAAATTVAVGGCVRPDGKHTDPSSPATSTGQPTSTGKPITGETMVQTDRWGDVPTYWVAGDAAQADCDVLMVMHGVNRNAADYRDSWEPLVAGRKLVVLAPEFSNDAFPGVENYNLGGMVDSRGVVTAKDSWSFRVIERVFDDFIERTGSRASTYSMFGHSAGAQFVHRYVAFTPQARVGRAVAANAGWYTMPDEWVKFPFGLENAPDTLNVERWLGHDLHVLLGADDVGDENLRTDDDANKQGRTRLERGMTFYQKGHDHALALKVPFGWSLTVVPGAEHDHVAMAKAALPLLFG